MGEAEKGTGGQMHGDGRFDFGWWTHEEYAGDVTLNCTLKAHIILLPTISPIYLVKFLKRSFQAWGREEGLEEEQRKEVVLRGVVLGDSHQSDFPHVHGP